jgi:hypothetical protein
MPEAGQPQKPITNYTGYRADPSWSPDSTHIVFTYGGGTSPIATIRPDGTDFSIIPGTSGHQPAWSPDGSTIAYTHFDAGAASTTIHLVSPSGANDRVLTAAVGPYQANPNWAPLGNRIAFEVQDGPDRGIYTVRPDGSDLQFVPGTTDDGDPAFSPTGFDTLVVRSPTGLTRIQIGDGARTPVTNFPSQTPDWGPPPQPPPPGFPRPKGATPFDVHLVPAYRQCLSGNEQHGPPLAVNSCSPPQQTSDYLTVGTLDANGQPAKFVGDARFDVHPGNASTPEDEADVAITVNMKDVRCRATFPTCDGGSLTDYGGVLQATQTIRITDNYNGPPRPELGPATLKDSFRLPFTIPCTTTSDTTIGSTCSVATTFDSVTPGVVKEGVRSNWELGQIQVLDGGPDGASPDESTMFAVEGIFVP